MKAGGVAAVVVLVLLGLTAREIGEAPVADANCSRGAIAGWDREQAANAAVIADVGADMDMGRRGVVVALATAMQESSLRNLGHLGAANDHDSLGLFQQRPSQGWGTPAQVRDPAYASKMFYRALKRVPGWRRMRVTDAAQAVQRSAYPGAYQQWADSARKLARALRRCE